MVGVEMNTSKNKHKNLTLFKTLGTMALFYVFWAISTVVGWSNILYNVRNFFGYDLYPGLLKIFFCVLFFILIKYYEKDLRLNLKNMFTQFDKKVFFIWFSILFFLELVMMFIINKGWHFNFNNLPLIIEFFIVGFTEEFICRGYVFNALYSKIDYKKANIVQAIYFALWHIVPYIPIWISNGEINMEQLQFVLVWNIPASIVIGLIFGHILKNTKSLWIPILLHMSMDYLAFLFYMT